MRDKEGRERKEGREEAPSGHTPVGTITKDSIRLNVWYKTYDYSIP
jgi:hypothetical protein